MCCTLRLVGRVADAKLVRVRLVRSAAVADEEACRLI
jgi:hypothetical protein